MFLEAKQWQIKQQAKGRLKSELLQTIAIPVSEVVWEEEGKELVVNGELFDIDSYQIKDGYVLASGILDKEETEFVKFLHKQTDKSKGTTLFVQWVIMSECLLNHVMSTAILHYDINPKRNFAFYLFNYSNPFPRVIIPPPKSSLA